MITVVGLAAMAIFLSKNWYIDRHDLTVMVEEADIPVTCNRATRGLFRRHPEQRDFAPADGDLFFCGLVWTDHGPFQLPDTRALPLIQTDRATLLSKLTPGCRVTVRVTGTAIRPSTDLDQERRTGRIIRVLGDLGCP